MSEENGEVVLGTKEEVLAYLDRLMKDRDEARAEVARLNRELDGVKAHMNACRSLVQCPCDEVLYQHLQDVISQKWVDSAQTIRNCNSEVARLQIENRDQSNDLKNKTQIIQEQRGLLEKRDARIDLLKRELSDRDNALEIARKEIGRLSFELDEMTEHSDHERKVAKTEIARMRTITEHAEKVVELYEKIRSMESAHKATDNSKHVFGPMPPPMFDGHGHYWGCPTQTGGKCDCATLDKAKEGGA